MVAVHIANRELVIPKYAHEKYEARGESEASGHAAQAIYDYESGILIDGKAVYPRLGKLDHAKFILPAGRVTMEMTVLKCKAAYYLEANR